MLWGMGGKVHIRWSGVAVGEGLHVLWRVQSLPSILEGCLCSRYVLVGGGWRGGAGVFLVRESWGQQQAPGRPLKQPMCMCAVTHASLN